MLSSLFLDIILGSSNLPVSELWHALAHPFSRDTSVHVIVWEIRLPYALMALLVGMTLGLAGAEMQTILNNPLASPFTLGVSSAAAFGAALAIVLGIGIPGISAAWFVPANAFIFALLSSLLLDSMSRWLRIASSGMILLGIALVFTFNALVAIMQFIADEDTLQGWYSGQWEAWLVHPGTDWVFYQAYLLLFFMVIFPLMATYGITHGRRKSVKFWYQCTATASFLPVTYKFACSIIGSLCWADWFYWSCLSTYFPDAIW